MSEQSQPDPTVDHVAASNRGLDGQPSLPAGASVLQALGANLPDMPRVHLREPLTEAVTPINRPGSPEMPETESPADFPPRLQLLGEIARGGMGAILKGRDVDLGRDIAIKVLLETHRGKTELAQRFLEEAQISGQLQHPGIAPVYELGVFPDKRPYFTMKLVKGHTLAAELEARKDLLEDRPKFLGIFAQVCQTLAYAHARGVLHRDLKPSNVMVGAFGEVQVMDWGLAKVLPEGGVADDKRVSRGRPRAENVSVIRTARSQDSDGSEAGSHTQAGTLLGTPAYMAPEQARGEVELVDERADVFGLGAILCQILTGQPPFTGKSAEAQRKAQAARLDDAYARLDGCGADAELIALTKRCLAAEPWDRPRHAGEVAEEVTAYQHAVAERLRQTELARAAEEARAIEARATAAQERKAQRMTLALAASVLLTMALGGGGWLWLRGEREDRRNRANRAVGEALNQAIALHEQARTAQGRAAMDRAAQARAQAQRAEALADSGSVDATLAAQVGQLLAELDVDEKDRQLLAALDAARLAQAEMNTQENRFASERAVPLFREACRAYGMAVGEGEATAVAARLGARPATVREGMLAALDEWVALAENPYVKMEEPHRDWLRAVLAAAEPEGWGKQVRDAAAEKDPAKRRRALEKLAESADVRRLPPQALTRLAARLQGARAEASAVALLRRAQAEHAGDFWINENLGKALSSQSEEAVRYHAAAVALRPDSAGARNNLGVALAEQGKRDEAIAEYKKAIDLDPKLALVHSNLGHALYLQHKLEEALTEYREALALDPKYATAHTGLGAILADQGKRDEAVAEYRKAIELDPKIAWPHNLLGIALAEQGQWVEAIAEYHKALDLAPKYVNARFNLGNALRLQDKLDEAIAEYRKAIELDPTSAALHDNLGFTFRLQGKLDEAIVECRKAIDLAPKYAWPHNSLGLALKEQGKRDEAIAEYKKAIELNPKYAAAYANLGNALKEQGKRDEALAEYGKAIELDPKGAGHRIGLGEVLWDKGDRAGALAEFRKAIEIEPKNDFAHYKVGLALKETGDRDGAFAEFHRAWTLNPGGTGARAELIPTLARQGRLEELRAGWQKFLEGNPPGHDAWYGYAELCLFLGREEEYRRHRRQLLQRFGNTTDPVIAERTGRACLLLPASGEELRQAATLADHAVAAGPTHRLYAYFELAKGLAQYRRDRPEEAIPLLRESASRISQLTPRLVLAMAQYRDGQKEEARQTLAAALAAHNWDEARAGEVDVRIYHVLRREAEELIVPHLADFLKGQYQPRENKERLELIEPCRFRKRYLAAARLFADVFAADAKLAEDRNAPHRYNAACFAALAAAGQGEDAKKLTDKERTRWRQQALDWLRAELVAYRKLLEDGKPENRMLVQQRLPFWRQDSDLAGIRDKDAVAKLPAEEQKACQQLWADVEALLAKAQGKPR